MQMPMLVLHRCILLANFLIGPSVLGHFPEDPAH